VQDIVKVGVCCYLSVLKLLQPHQTYYVDGEFMYKSNPTRWLRITRQQVWL